MRLFRSSRLLFAAPTAAPESVIRSGPAVQRLVQENPHVADKLGSIKPTGHNGRFTKGDIIYFLANKTPPPPAAATGVAKDASAAPPAASAGVASGIALQQAQGQRVFSLRIMNGQRIFSLL